MGILQARNIEATPNGFEDALQLAMGLPVQTSPIEALRVQTGQYVILIDTF